MEGTTRPGGQVQPVLPGSGAQSRAIVAGFEADAAALSLNADIARIQEAGLIKHDWKATENGVVSRSIVVLAVRKGNPKGIKDWADLAKPGVQIVTPDPKTSGGAQWNIAALWGAAMRGKVTSVPANDSTASQAFLASVLKNVWYPPWRVASSWKPSRLGNSSTVSAPLWATRSGWRARPPACLTRRTPRYLDPPELS